MAENKLTNALLSLVLVGTLVSTYYAYDTNKMLNGAAAGTQSSGTPVSISEKYAKDDYTLEKAMDSGKPVIALFYADWCGFCQSFAPTFARIIKTRDFKKNLAAAYVNCDDPANDKYIKEYKIEGFPSVFMINPKTGEKTKVGNNLLFVADAEKSLLKRFVEFAQK